MVTHYLIKTHSFLTQQLNIYYSLKDLSSLLFSEFSLEPLNPFRRFLKCFIIFTFYFILYLFYFCLVPGILELWCLVTATFKFTVFYNNIYKKKKNFTLCFPMQMPKTKCYQDYRKFLSYIFRAEHDNELMK